MEYEKIIMNLILALNNDNLEQTKQYVNLLKTYNYDINHLTGILNIHNTEYDLDNQSFDYVLEHLTLNRADDIRWKRNKEKLLLENNKENIKKFIYSQLNYKTYEIDQHLFIQDLIGLTVRLTNEEISEIFKILLTQL